MIKLTLGHFIFRAPVVVSIAVLCSSCDPKAPLQISETIANYTRSDLRQTETEAWWTFQDFLGSLRSKENYVVGGLFTNPHGQWTLHSHFNGFQFRDGIQITAKRDHDQLSFVITTPQFQSQAIQIESPFQNDLGEFRYRIEIHNGTAEGARILIWKDWQSLQSEVVTKRSPITAANAEHDSRRTNGVFWSSGRGARWGLEFQGVQITRVTREAPYAP